MRRYPYQYKPPGRRSVRDVPDHPMIERAARRVGVIDHQCQALRAGGDRSERQRRTGIAAVAGVLSRNRLTIRKCGTRNLHPMRGYLLGSSAGGQDGYTNVEKQAIHDLEAYRRSGVRRPSECGGLPPPSKRCQGTALQRLTTLCTPSPAPSALSGRNGRLAGTPACSRRCR